MSEFGTNPTAREIAERLLAFESGEQYHPGTDAPPAVQVCQKLVRNLSKIIGEIGSRALLARALTLAKREAEVLTPVRMTDDGALEGLQGGAMGASTVVVGHFVGLLETFLGESLTLRLLHDVWPDRTTLDAHFGERNGNESAQ
jgi:hypothetical protein